MNSLRRCFRTAWLIVALISFNAWADAAHRLASPDGRLQVVIQMPAPDSTQRPQWAAGFRGKMILTNCTLGLQTTDAGELLAAARVVRQHSQAVDHRIPVLFGKADHAEDRFRETRFTLETPQHRRLEVVFRCYNDAIAFRYELPEDGHHRSVTIADENSAFGIEGNPTAYAQYLESYTTSHEHNVTTARCQDLQRGVLLDLPLTFSWEDGTYAAITEGALRHYAGMSLMRPASTGEGGQLVCKLTPRPDGTKVLRPLPMQTPWRVVLVADRPGALLESGTLYCLNEPSVVTDVSWIKPGKITFSWWNGDVYDGQRSLPILSLEMAKKYIDFCVRNGIPTHSLTSDEQTVSPWYFQTKQGVALGRTRTSRVRARTSTCRPSAATRNRSTCGSGPGCTRVHCVDGLRKPSRPSKKWAGAA